MKRTLTKNKITVTLMDDTDILITKEVHPDYPDSTLYIGLEDSKFIVESIQKLLSKSSNPPPDQL